MSTEHYMDRWQRLNCKFNVVYETEKGYWFNHCKIGNLSNKRIYFWENPVTELNTCELCGLTSTPKKVHYRSCVYGWNWKNNKDYQAESLETLCMGCWNKVRVQVKRSRELDEIRRLTKKLYKEALRCQKLQTQAS